MATLAGAVSVAHTSVVPSARRFDRLAHQVRIVRVIAASEFKLNYADSALGYLWSLIKPLALFSVLYMVFARLFKLTGGFENYPLYLLIGLVLWTFLIDATNLTMTSIVARGSLLRKLSFPRITVPLSVTVTAGITFCVNLVAIVAFIVWSRVTPRLEWLLLVPLLVELFLFVLGIGLILATLYVRFRDVGQVWDLGSQLMFYASPIIYPVALLPPKAKVIVFLNPFVQIMQDVRAIIDEADPVETAGQVLWAPAGRLIPIALAFFTFALGVALFRRASPHFAEHV